MKTHIPSSIEVASAMASLNRQQVLKLAALSGVSYFTLDKIRRGITTDPGIETVRAFWDHIKGASK